MILHRCLRISPSKSILSTSRSVIDFSEVSKYALQMDRILMLWKQAARTILQNLSTLQIQNLSEKSKDQQTATAFNNSTSLTKADQQSQDLKPMILVLKKSNLMTVKSLQVSTEVMTMIHGSTIWAAQFGSPISEQSFALISFVLILLY